MSQPTPTQNVSGTPPPGGDGAAPVNPTPTVSGGSKKPKQHQASAAAGALFIDQVYAATRATLQPARLPKTIRDAVGIPDDVTVYFLEGKHVVDDAKRNEFCPVAQYWAITSNEQYHDITAMFSGERFFAKWAKEHASEVFVVFSPGRTPLILLKKLDPTRRAIFGEKHVKHMFIGGTETEMTSGDYSSYYRLSFPASMFCAVELQVQELAYSTSLTARKDKVVQMDLVVPQGKFDVLSKLMKDVAVTHALNVLSSKARDRQMTVRLPKNWKPLTEGETPEDALLDVATRLQLKAAQCLLRTGTLRVTAETPRSCFELGEELKSQGMSVFYDVKPTEMANLYTGLPSTVADSPAAVAAKKVNSVEMYHIRSMGYQTDEAFKKAAAAIQGCHYVMWHRTFACVVFDSPADVPTTLPFQVPVTDQQPVKGLVLAHWSDF